MNATHINLATEDTQRLQQLVFQRYQINFDRQNQGHNQLDAAFLSLIQTAFTEPGTFPTEALRQCSLVSIIDYLERTHQLYLNKRLPEIGQSIRTLHRNYDVPKPNLMLLDVFFKRYSEHLSEHIQEEEQDLFPYVQELQRASLMEVVPQTTQAKAASGLLNRFLHEHTDTESDLHWAQKAIREYQPSHTNSSPYRILLDQLATLELDLNIHSRLEEAVLIPKAMELEQQVRLRSKG